MCVSTSCLIASEIPSVVLNCLLLWGCDVSIQTDQFLFWFSPCSLPLPSKDTFCWGWEWDTDQPGLWDLTVRHGGGEWEHPFHLVSSHGTWPAAFGFVMALRAATTIGLWDRRGVGHLEKKYVIEFLKKLFGKRCSWHWDIECHKLETKFKCPALRPWLRELWFN